MTDDWDWSWGKDPLPCQGPQAPHPLFLLLPADLYEKIGSNSLEANPRNWKSGQFCRSGSTLLRAIQMWLPAPSPALPPSGNSPTLSQPSLCSCASSPESPFGFHFHSYTSSSCGPVHAWQTSSYSPSLKGVLVRHSLGVWLDTEWFLNLARLVLAPLHCFALLFPAWETDGS